MSGRKEVFDETYLSVTLKGGSNNTEIIQVEAVAIAGQLKGQSLPLKCQWFNVTKDNDFISIEEVTGQYYQPCILDVDSRIMVQAIPILDQEYVGMPISKETGFLQMDPKITDQVSICINEVNKYYKDGSLSIPCKLEHINGDVGDNFKALELPIEMQLTISEQETTIYIANTNLISEYQRVDLKVIRKNSNQLEMQANNTKFVFRVANNLCRDVVYQFWKTLKGKNKLADTTQLYATITDYAQLVEQKDTEISKLNEQLQKDKNKMKEISLQLANTTKKSDQNDKQLLVYKQSIAEKDKEIYELKQKVDKLEGKNTFYIQEINILKSQLVNLESQKRKLSCDLEESKKVQNQNQDEIREAFYRDKVEAMKQQNEKCIKENQQWQVINDQLLKEIKQMQTALKQISEDKENYQNELNSLKKKYESLMQEVSQQKLPDRSESNSEIGTKSQNGDWDEDQQEEIKRLKITVINLEQTLKNQRHNYEQDMLQMMNSKQNTKVQDIQLLQKLANSLAESVADKELAIQNQRKINKELVIKIQELNK